MTYRYKATNVNFTANGTTLAHGLAFTPDEYFISYRGAQQTGTGMVVFFMGTCVDATNIYLSSYVTATVDVFAHYNYSTIR